MNVIISIMTTKSKKNKTKSPHKCHPRPMHSEINKYIHNYLIGKMHEWKM